LAENAFRAFIFMAAVAAAHFVSVPCSRIFSCLAATTVRRERTSFLPSYFAPNHGISGARVVDAHGVSRTRVAVLLLCTPVASTLKPPTMI